MRRMLILMATIQRRPPLVFRVAASRADTFTGTSPVPRLSLVRAVQAALALRHMGKIKVRNLEFASTPKETRCIVKVSHPRTERQRFIAEFGGFFTTETATEHHVIRWYFIEF
jgi:hypothetical protein